MSDEIHSEEGIQVIEEAGNGLRLRLPAGLDARNTPVIWERARQTLSDKPHQRLVLDAEDIREFDMSAVAMLLELRRAEEAAGRTVEIVHPPSRLQNLLHVAGRLPELPPVRERRLSFVEEVGRATSLIASDQRRFIEFIGELAHAAGLLLARRQRVKWREMGRIAEQAGANAFPLVALIGFLLGLILAYQSAIPMNMFGAGIFVANLVSLSLVRELGPLITAIIFAGRSGSAFAAELGTMKVNDEINALTTMGLQPVSFLAVPRILASLLVMPMLAIFAILFGIIGAAPVILSLGYPLTTYCDRVAASIKVDDLLGGLFKAVIFGLLISAIGCHQGLQTRSGAQAVGESTTRAVVQSIIFIAVADGLFAVVFYHLGI